MKKFINDIAFLLFLILIAQPVFSQSDEIIIGVDSELVIIKDIEDIHLKPGEENTNSAWFDLDGNGLSDIGFWVAHTFFETNSFTIETRGVTIKADDDAYIFYNWSPTLEGYCDSLYMDGGREMAVHYEMNSILSAENDTNYLRQYPTAIAVIRTKTVPDPCYVHYSLPQWIGNEGYIAFKKVLLNTTYLGWFKIEVLDYDEVIIKEYAVSNKEWGYGLYINEIMASNKTTITDEFNEYDDWIEIYNAKNDSIWLGNLYLTDNLMWPDQWQMPDTTIAAGKFLLIWADNQTDQGKCHANFKLDKDGGEVGIFTEVLKKIDAYTYHEQTSDISIGRLPNGEEEWIFFVTPTPGASNEVLDIPETVYSNLIIISPNPASGNIVQLSESCNFGVYNMMGQPVVQQKNSHLIEISQYNKGMYFVVIDNGQTLKLIIQ